VTEKYIIVKQQLDYKSIIWHKIRTVC